MYVQTRTCSINPIVPNVLELILGWSAMLNRRDTVQRNCPCLPKRSLLLADAGHWGALMVDLLAVAGFRNHDHVDELSPASSRH